MQTGNTGHGEDKPRNSDPTTGLALDDVSHGFDEIDVLKDISLSIRSGETVAIIGPSGTGKTTLLRLFAQFYPPDEGTVTLDGTDVWQLSTRERLAVRRRIGMVFQTPNLFDASVSRNVRYGHHIRRSWRDRLLQWIPGLGPNRPTSGALSKDPVTDSTATNGAVTDDAVTDALDVVGLADAATQRAASLSGGEAQRVAFARAIAYDPDVLLLDEPTSDLDPRNTADIEAAIKTARERGLGVAIATHDMHQAERVADRVAVLLDGRIIECGPADRVFTDPVDPRARKFIDGELVY